MRRLMKAVERAHFLAVLRELETETLTFAPEVEPTPEAANA